MKEYGLYIDGQWTAAAGGRTFQTISPTTGEILAVFAAGDSGDGGYDSGKSRTAPGVLNVVTGPADRVGTAIVEHPATGAVSTD